MGVECQKGAREQGESVEQPSNGRWSWPSGLHVAEIFEIVGSGAKDPPRGVCQPWGILARECEEGQLGDRDGRPGPIQFRPA
jgi:hypothetical protein